MTERDIHIAVARLLDTVLEPPAIWSTFPAGGGGKARGGQFKAMGLKPGWPDIIILHPTGVFWIELKTAKGRLSPEQKEAHDLIHCARGHVAVCRSVDDVMTQLQMWLLPLRGRIAA